jgi:hypothetical protein
MEVRIKALESYFEYVRADLTSIKSDVRELRSIHDRDFRIAFGALVFSVLGLASFMAKGVKWF